MRAALHLSDVGRASRAFGNAANLLTDEAGVDDVVLVANGDGVIALLLDSDNEMRVEQLLDAGLTIRACSNSLDRNSLDEDDLVSGVETVPSGVVHLTELQDQGWAYIKS